MTVTPAPSITVDEERWGSRFTVGVEEELLLVDRETLALAHIAPELMAAIHAEQERADSAVRANVGYEAYAAQIEIRSQPATTAHEAVDSVREARAAATRAGATLMGAGLHPTGLFGDVQLVEGERYALVERRIRGLMWRTPESALHVHVGVPNREAALAVFNGLREALPLLEGLAANSPWWFGVDSGTAAARALVVRARPGVEVPPAFSSWDEYLDHLQDIVSAGGPSHYRDLWWHLRLHPTLGTVELREMDAQSRLGDAAALAALVHGLAVAAAEEPITRPTSAAALTWSSWYAARDGIDAEILYEGRVLPLRKAAQEARSRAASALRFIGCDADLSGIDRMLADGNGASRRRVAFARGGIEAMLRELADESGPRDLAD